MLGFAVLAVALLVALPTPFTGDQALFAVGAQKIAHGGVYYVDFWDVKQPGIYWFVTAARTTFGDSTVGIHTFEALWLLATALVVWYCLRDRFTHRVVAAFIPVVVVALPLLMGRPQDQTKVEDLVGLPLFVALWCVSRAVDDPDRASRWFAASGVAAAVVVVFKVPLLLLVVGFWIVGTTVLVRRHGTRAGRRAVAAAVTGLTIPVLVVVVVLVLEGAGSRAWDTTFVYPLHLGGTGSLHTAELARGFLRVSFENYAALAVVALAGLVVAGRRALDPLTAGLLTWIGLGVVVILPQRWSAYQRMLLAVPITVLALQGADALWRAWDEGRFGRRRGVAGAFVLVVLVLLLPASRQPWHRVRLVAQHGFALTAADREAIAREEPEYATVRAEVSRLGRLPDAGRPIYVLGDPLVYRMLGRPQAAAVNGWSPEQLVDVQWRWLRDELDESRPRFVFVDRFSRRHLDADGAPVARLLAAHYRVVHRSPSRDDKAITQYEADAAWRTARR